jgi:hypothetical protein
MSCFKCLHSFLAIGDKISERKCRLNPPQCSAVAFPTPQGVGVQIITAWPTVRDEDRCAHWVIDPDAVVPPRN